MQEMLDAIRGPTPKLPSTEFVGQLNLPFGIHTSQHIPARDIFWIAQHVTPVPNLADFDR
jgi:hypothetical protein